MSDLVALGLCRVRDVTAGMPTLAAGTLAVLTSAATAAVQDRLDRYLDLHQRLPTLLPFAPRRAPSVARAQEMALTDQAALMSWLDQIAGLSEMTVVLALHGPTPKTGAGRDWLRARGVRHRRMEELTAWLDRLCPAEASRIDTCILGSGRFERTLMMPAAAMPGLAAAFNAACPTDVTCRCTGPWPVFAHTAQRPFGRQKAA